MRAWLCAAACCFIAVALAQYCGAAAQSGWKSVGGPGGGSAPPGGRPGRRAGRVRKGGGGGWGKTKTSVDAAAVTPVPRTIVEPTLPPARGAYLFVDKISEWLPWQEQSQKGWTGPCFTDLDGTGLGYVNLHHYGPCSPEAISSALERITKNKLKPEDPDYTYCDTTYEWEFGFRDPDKPGFVHMPHGPRHFRLLDVLKVKGDKDQMQKIDVHGFGLIDLDRDGRKDFYGQIGASSGTGLSDRTMNTLFWGTGEVREHLLGGGSGDNSGDVIPFQLVGGRHTALAAGLESRLGRSRHLLFLDADMDGLLDIYLCNVARADGLFFTSQLYVSQGAGSPRKRVLAEGVMSDITMTAIVTDLDGDGWAREVLMARNYVKYCAQLQRGDAIRMSEEDQAAFLSYCQTNRPATVAMYKLDLQGGVVRLDDNTVPILSAVREWDAVDMDGDGRADLVDCGTTSLRVFPSSLRQPGEMPSVATSYVIDRWNDCAAMSCFVRDLDFDGSPEILMVCDVPGTNRLYERTSVNPLKYQRVSAQAANLDGKLPPGIAPVGAHGGKKLPLQSKGVSTSDIDDDGFPEVYLVYDGPDKFLQNRAHEVLGQRGEPLPRYVALWLEGVKSNKEAVGASVVLWAKGVDPAQPEAVTPQVHEVRRSGRSRGFDDERVVFGLGPRGSIDRVEVRWPLTDAVQVIPGADLQPLNNINAPHFIVEPAAAV